MPGQSGRAAGTLTITAAGDQLRWHEAGQLHWAGRIVAVTRDLELHLLDGAWWVSFADGRPFHPWLVGEPLVHPCAADLYLGRIALDAGGNLLRVAWDVTGPSKAQRIITRHRRRLVLPRADDRPLAIP